MRSLPASPTVAQLLDLRLADLTATRKARAENTPYYHKPLNVHFGHLQPHQITPFIIQQYWVKRQDRPASLREEVVELDGVLQRAVKRGLIPSAPKLEIPPKRPPKEEFLSREQAQALLDAATSPHLSLYLSIAMTTGARKGAILGLTWDRVNLDRRRIDFTDPTRAVTKKRRTVVPVSPNVVATLRLARDNAETGFVIEYMGAPIKDIRKAFSEAAKRAGLPWATPHMLKHSVVSWLAEDGYTADEISDITATHPDTVWRVYRKINPDYMNGMATSLGEGFRFATVFAKRKAVPPTVAKRKFAITN